ncbi:uncharacterized protein PFLUO_LOCUS6692 [Penicillium psychrofluorescens]|uniref:uncharacterized protein n=1 Tax=Penicillium psychrofluorescens TaxID=3158075 RepID=UPI003CCE22DD
MESVTSLQVQQKALLRDKYTKAVSNLLETIESKPKATYASDDLTKLGVTLTFFDPEEPDFLHSNDCLFNPMSLEEVKSFSLEGAEIEGGALDYYLGFDKD